MAASLPVVATNVGGNAEAVKHGYNGLLVPTDDPESLTAAINQLPIDPAKAVTIRGLSLERGITVRRGRCHVEAALPGILEDSNARLSGASRLLLAQLKLELEHLQSRIEEADEAIRHNGPNTLNRN